MNKLALSSDVDIPELPSGVIRVSDIMDQPENLPRYILPGTFDPIHDGHVEAKRKAETALEEPVAIMVVENINKPEKEFSLEERIQLVQERFPDETIYAALTPREITVSHKEAKNIVRKKRPGGRDTKEYLGLCVQYDIDPQKVKEFEVPEISSNRFKIAAIIFIELGENWEPSGISSTAFQMLVKKYDHLRPENQPLRLEDLRDK